jgi:hypothetical protein
MNPSDLIGKYFLIMDGLRIWDDDSIEIIGLKDGCVVYIHDEEIVANWVIENFIQAIGTGVFNEITEDEYILRKVR